MKTVCKRYPDIVVMRFLILYTGKEICDGWQRTPGDEGQYSVEIMCEGCRHLKEKPK